MAVAPYEQLFRDETKFSQTKSVGDDLVRVATEEKASLLGFDAVVRELEEADHGGEGVLMDVELFMHLFPKVPQVMFFLGTPDGGGPI